MKDKQFDYNTFPNEVDTVEDMANTGTPLKELAGMIRNCGHNFDLLLLFEVIFKKLHPLFSIDCGALILYDKEVSRIEKSYVSVYSAVAGNVCSEIINDPVALSGITTEIAGFGFPVLKSRENWIEETGENHCPHSAPHEYLFHCYIPLEINNETLGTLELHNHYKQLSTEGLSFCCNIADLLAELVFTVDSQPAKPIVEAHPGVSKDYNLLLRLCNTLTAVRSRDELVAVSSEYIGQLFKFSYMEILLSNADDRQGLSSISVFRETKTANQQPLPVSQIAEEHVFLDIKSAVGPKEILVADLEKIGWKPGFCSMLQSLGIATLIVSPLRTANEFTGVIFTGLQEEHFLTSSERLLLQGISAQLSVAFGNMLAFERIKHQLHEISSFRQLMEEEKLCQTEEIEVSSIYDEMIGQSKEMQQIFKLLSNVAGTETTVLVLGETGTGKELIAKAIHNASDRKDNQMIKVNCAAIPPNLIESELFGHEKGSFTGATERRIGKFELANNSTLFLDEIGELSLDLQVKLLRVLQEKEFERVGGKTTLTADVRIVSATNRNLLEEVEAGRFRSDLFYRLNVFPIALPALRNRKEDIPVLARHFLSRFAEKCGKKIDGFSQKALGDMMKYYWPGNIRELEHLIERQVLLTKGPIIKELEIPSEKTITAQGTPISAVKTISENERDHIFAVLQMCNGKISGKDGAAKLLDVPATTLNSKIKRLGLAKKHVF